MEEKKMTPREKAVQAIKEGNSVFVDGIQYSLTGNPDTGCLPLSKLPSDADFAVGNPEEEKRALGNIQEEIKKLEEARARLTAAQKEAKASAPKEEVKTAEVKTEEAK